MCFMYDNKKDLARRQFERVIPKIPSHEKPDLFKKAHYYLAVLCEEAGKADEAENLYMEILALDYEYKDVRKRLERLQGGQAD